MHNVKRGHTISERKVMHVLVHTQTLAYHMHTHTCICKQIKSEPIITFRKETRTGTIRWWGRMENKQTDKSCTKGHRAKHLSGLNSGMGLLFLIFNSECIKSRGKPHSFRMTILVLHCDIFICEFVAIK